MTPTRTLPGWLTRMYPFAPRTFATAHGARMSYLDEGPRTDEAVLMLHGNPTWSFHYRDLVQALAPTMRCVVPDHVGMGLSDKPPDYDYRLATRIADVTGLVDSMGLKRVHLVVHDWGGAIGFGLAARNADRIGRIVILNTAAFHSRRMPLRIAACRVPVFGPLLVRGLNGFAGPATTMAMHRRKLSAEEKRGYLWPYDSWANRVAVNAFVRDIPVEASHSSRAALAGVEQGVPKFRSHPAMILWGGKDFCFNDHFLSRWREFLPEAEVHRIADAGHYVLEDAREDVIPRAVEFLATRAT